MKKIVFGLLLFTFITLTNSHFVFAKTNVSEIESRIIEAFSSLGYIKDEDMKIISPSQGQIYKTGNTIDIKTQLKGKALSSNLYSGALLNIKGKDKYRVEENKEMDKFKDFSIPITNDIPSGDYVVFLSSIYDYSGSFTMTRPFKIETEKPELPDSDFEIIEKVEKNKTSNTKDKANNAVIMANLSDARAQAELYFDKNNSFKDVCINESKDKYGILTQIKAAENASGYKSNCDSGSNAWAAEIKLKAKQGYYCVDSTGRAITQKKSKGTKATACDGSVDKTKINKKDSAQTYNFDLDNPGKSSDIVIKKIVNLENTYSPEKITKFSVSVLDGKGKPFTVSDGSFYISSIITQVDTGQSEPTVQLGLGTYNKKNKVYDFDMITPSKAGKYVIDITAYCPNLNSDSECYKKIGTQSPYTSVYIYIEGTTSKAATQKVTVLSPNGGEKITNTGSVNIKYSMPVNSSYGLEMFLIPSSNTSFTLGNARDGVRGYFMGGSGSPYNNNLQIQGGAWSLPSVPDGKYKLRIYYYPYRSNLQYSVSEALAMDESDDYFLIDTSNSNQY